MDRQQIPVSAYESPWMNDDVRMFRKTVSQFVQKEFVPYQARWREQNDMYGRRKRRPDDPPAADTYPMPAGDGVVEPETQGARTVRVRPAEPDEGEEITALEREGRAFVREFDEAELAARERHCVLEAAELRAMEGAPRARDSWDSSSISAPPDLGSNEPHNQSSSSRNAS